MESGKKDGQHGQIKEDRKGKRKGRDQKTPLQSSESQASRATSSYGPLPSNLQAPSSHMSSLPPFHGPPHSTLLRNHHSGPEPQPQPMPAMDNLKGYIWGGALCPLQDCSHKRLGRPLYSPDPNCCTPNLCVRNREGNGGLRPSPHILCQPVPPAAKMEHIPLTSSKASTPRSFPILVT